MTPSVLRTRATQLLVGGLLGWHGGLLLAGVAGTLVSGWVGLVSAVLGAALALAYYAIGQGTQVAFADSPVRTIRAASVLSYVVRVVALGILLGATLTWPSILARVDTGSLAAGIILGVLGWLVGLVLRSRKQRVPVFDEPPLTRYDPSDEGC